MKRRKRFAIVIGVAAVGVMALGAQTGAQTTGDPVDITPPDLQLSGPKKQSPQNAKPIGASHCPRSLACYLEVRSSCGDEACFVRATGRLTNVKKYKLFPTGCVCPRAGETFDLGPELANAAQRREVRQALANGEHVKAKVTVRAAHATAGTDADSFREAFIAGNVATAKRTITLVK